MDCLRYLIDLYWSGHRFSILYDGNHCIGVNEKKIFEIGNTFKKHLLNQSPGKAKYLNLEESISLDVAKKIFNLTPEETAKLNSYYKWKKEN